MGVVETAAWEQDGGAGPPSLSPCAHQHPVLLGWGPAGRKTHGGTDWAEVLVYRKSKNLNVLSFRNYSTLKREMQYNMYSPLLSPILFSVISSSVPGTGV